MKKQNVGKRVVKQKPKRKRIIRQDKVREQLPRLNIGKTHSAYSWMRKVREGKMPPANTNLRKALDAVEISLIEYFGELNPPQQIVLNLIRPVLAFWMLHPGTAKSDDMRLASDFKWAHMRIQHGITAMVALANKNAAASFDYDQWRKKLLAVDGRTKKQCQNKDQ
ncbi:MAG: hypothetical protein JRJ12_15550 [Deltaproteobacteria bacterium]|nr:hypothetical protein [Deltaproteobacteria bacterium]